MSPDSLIGLGISAKAISQLHQRGIRTREDLGRTFYLPEQHPLLAELLQIPLEEATALVRRSVEGLPLDELEKLAREVRRIEQIPFGVLPPQHEEEPS